MEKVVENNVLSLTKRNMQDYLQTHDVRYIAQDAIYRNMSTGESHKGRTEIAAMLHYIYQVAFDASIVTTNLLVTEKKAMVEGFFKGRHIGEFAGIPATNKEIDVPICVTYDLEGGFINEARIYMAVNVLLQQLST